MSCTIFLLNSAVWEDWGLSAWISQEKQIFLNSKLQSKLLLLFFFKLGWTSSHTHSVFLFLFFSVIKVKVKSLSHVWLFATPWTVACQAPLSMGFSRQEYWSRLPFPSPGNLSNPGIEPRSSALQADTLTSEPPGKPKSSSNYLKKGKVNLITFYLTQHITISICN